MRETSYSLLLPARVGEERFPRYLGRAITPQTHYTSGAPVRRFRFNSSVRLVLVLRRKRQAGSPRLAVCSGRSFRARVQRVDSITANHEVHDPHGPSCARKILLCIVEGTRETR